MEHTNYCRAVVKQEDVRLAGIRDKMYRQEHAPGGWHISPMDMAVGLIHESEKFLLPEGGHILDDKELRALDECIPLRLPHRFIALEYLAVNAPTHRRRIVLCRERDVDIAMTVVVFDEKEDRWLRLDGECSIPLIGYVDRDRTSAGCAYMKFTWPSGTPVDEWGDEVGVVLGFLNALHCSNVRIGNSPAKRNVHAKKTKMPYPFDDYHVLTIEAPTRAVNTEAGSTGAAQAAHRSPREHLRRGHIVRPGDGRRPYWRNATVVNAGCGAGRIEKDSFMKPRSFPP